jgi:hypothetical protein
MADRVEQEDLPDQSAGEAALGLGGVRPRADASSSAASAWERFAIKLLALGAWRAKKLSTTECSTSIETMTTELTEHLNRNHTVFFDVLISRYLWPL